MPKLKPACLRKTKNTWSPWSRKDGWKGRKGLMNECFIMIKHQTFVISRPITLTHAAYTRGSSVAFTRIFFYHQTTIALLVRLRPERSINIIPCDLRCAASGRDHPQRGLGLSGPIHKEAHPVVRNPR